MAKENKIKQKDNCPQVRVTIFYIKGRCNRALRKGGVEISERHCGQTRSDALILSFYCILSNRYN